MVECYGKTGTKLSLDSRDSDCAGFDTLSYKRTVELNNQVTNRHEHEFMRFIHPFCFIITGSLVVCSLAFTVDLSVELYGSLSVGNRGNASFS